MGSLTPPPRHLSLTVPLFYPHRSIAISCVGACLQGVRAGGFLPYGHGDHPGDVESERGADGRLFSSTMLVSRCPVALTSPPEGSAAMSMLARASLPACFAFLTLSYTLLRVLLTARVHRPMASTKVFARWFRTAQSRPMVPAIEAAAEDAAAGHHSSAQEAGICQCCRVGRLPPLLADLERCWVPGAA